MKRIIMCLLLSLSLVGLKAQFYRGSVDLTYQVGVGEQSFDRTEFSVINGVQINPHYYVGIGVGITVLESANAFYAPLFLNFETVLKDSKISPFIDIRAGYAFNIYDEFDYLSTEGAYCSAFVGYRFKWHQKKGMKISLGYNTLIAKEFEGFYVGSPESNKSLGGIGARIAFQF